MAEYWASGDCSCSLFLCGSSRIINYANDIWAVCG